MSTQSEPKKPKYVVKELGLMRSFSVGHWTFSVEPQRCYFGVTSFDWRDMSAEHYWPAHGTASIWHFIVMLQDPHYVLNKLFDDSKIREIDPEATRAAVIAAANEEVEDGSLSSEARDEIIAVVGDDYDFENSAAVVDGFVVWDHMCYRDTMESKEFWEAFCVFREYVKTTVIPGLPKETPVVSPKPGTVPEDIQKFYNPGGDVRGFYPKRDTSDIVALTGDPCVDDHFYSAGPLGGIKIVGTSTTNGVLNLVYCTVRGAQAEFRSYTAKEWADLVRDHGITWDPSLRVLPPAGAPSGASMEPPVA